MTRKKTKVDLSQYMDKMGLGYIGYSKKQKTLDNSKLNLLEVFNHTRLTNTGQDHTQKPISAELDLSKSLSGSVDKSKKVIFILKRFRFDSI